MIVGVLALQGGFRQILAQLKALRVEAVDVRNTAELAKVDALVIPGGESTAVGVVLSRPDGMTEALRDFAKNKPVLGICAGLILLANSVENRSYKQNLLGGLDIVVTRNIHGMQSQSAVRTMTVLGSAKAEGVSGESHFIRAPGVKSVGAKVETLADCDDIVVAVRQGHLMGIAFHPELMEDTTWLAYFLNVVCAPSDAASDKSESSSNAWVRVEPFAPKPRVQSAPGFGLESVKRGLPVYLQGGVIMDVVNGEQAKIAETAGACSVMALERIPADIKADGGIARMSDPALIKEVQRAVSIPVMAKARIGHFAEAQILEALDVDCIDESEVLTCADESFHIDKKPFTIPFVCGAKDLGEALRRIAEGASLIRLKGNAGTGNVMHAVRHARMVFGEIRQLQACLDDEVYVRAKELKAPLALVEETRRLGRLPVVTFAAGGLSTPADVKMLMDLGCDGVFVGSGIFKGNNPEERAKAMVQACTFHRNAKIVAEVSENLGSAMVGILDKGESYACVNNDSKLY
jgi:pyridoxal 5'-phosphate synthase pdxS subunit